MRLTAEAADTRSLLLVPVFFGLLSGTGEAIGDMVMQALPSLTGVGYAIFWIAPIFNTLVFLGIGFVMLLAARLVPAIRRPDVFVSAFALLAFLDWITLAFKQTIHPASLVLFAIGLTAVVVRWSTKRPAIAARIRTRGTVLLGVTTLFSLVGITAGSRIRERVALSGLPSAAPSAPNVLVLLLDATRADHLSGYGYPRNTSPNLDRLAAEGVLFENAVSASSYSLPSHVSLLSGLYPSEHEASWLDYRIRRTPSVPWLPELMGERGYRTAAFSANTFWFTREQGFGRGFIRYEDFFHSVPDMMLRTIIGSVFWDVIQNRLRLVNDLPGRKRADDVNRHVIRWLDRSGDAPFFIFINFFDVHEPYLPPEPYLTRFSETADGRFIDWLTGTGSGLTPEKTEDIVAAYDGGIAWTDAQVGHLLDMLRERGLADNLIVAVTSDHGEAFGEHGTYLHSTSLYREEIHVPLILWGPGRIPAGVRSQRPVSNAWIGATVLDLLDPDVSVKGDSMPGIPLRRAWEDPTSWSDAWAPISELEQLDWKDPELPVQSGSLRSLLTPEWHLLQHTRDGFHLFDWRNDVLEANDLAGDPRYADLLARLSAHFDALPPLKPARR